MIARILCPGPSLAETAAPLRGMRNRGLVLAVNGASRFTLCDWLVSGDREGLTAKLPAGKTWNYADGTWAYGAPLLGLVSFAATIRGLIARDNPDEARFWGLQFRQWEDLPEPDCAKQWSFQAALLLAHQLGCTDLQIYGADQRGRLDFDGHDPQATRDDDRWTRERDAIATTIAYLQRRGCTITRHQPTRTTP